MKKQTFQDYLMEAHSDQYVGLDDMMTDDFEDWLQGLDVQELIDYAEKWGEKLMKKLLNIDLNLVEELHPQN